MGRSVGTCYCSATSPKRIPPEVAIRVTRSKEKANPRSALANSRGLEITQLVTVDRTLRSACLVASRRATGGTAARVAGGRTVRASVGGTAVAVVATASRTSGGGTGNRGRRAADGRGSGTGRGGGATASGSGGTAASGSGAVRVSDGGAAHGSGGSTAGRGSRGTRRSATVVAGLLAQVPANSATLVAAVAMATLLAALRANLLALHLVTAARGRSAARWRWGTAARGGRSRATMGREGIRHAGTNEQNGDRKRCPLHVWYYSWKGTSGTETVANPRNHKQSRRSLAWCRADGLSPTALLEFHTKIFVRNHFAPSCERAVI